MMLTGGAACCCLLQTLPAMQHIVKSSVYQPTPQNTILILVNGDCMLQGETNLIKFSEVFILAAADQQGNFYVQNDIFSLNYG